jgi:hypothetical protein
MIAYDRLLSTDNPKAAKAADYGWINGIHYMAPATLSGFNLCARSTPQCEALCLGWQAGQASMVADPADMNAVRLSRVAKARAYVNDRPNYLNMLVRSIARLERQGERLGLRVCVRPNGSTDIPFERVPVTWLGVRYPNIMAAFPSVQFTDYTKRWERFNQTLPPNYHLTFSRADGNSERALLLLDRGVNVAVVSRRHNPKQGRYLEQWCGYAAINGDEHDLRHLDPQGVVVALSPKGPAAKRMARADMTGEGFIL